MFRSGYVLDAQEEIGVAILNKARVRIHQNGKLLELGGVVERQTEDSVVINGDHYLKALCVFRITS